MEKISYSAEQTENMGKNLAKKLKGKEIIALYGDLGVGKTSLVRGIADFFGVKNMVSSPTFSLINEYQTSEFKIYHFDMYRVRSFEDLESTGFFDYIYTGVIIIEWSENIERDLPSDVIKIHINKVDDSDMRIVNAKGVEI